MKKLFLGLFIISAILFSVSPVIAEPPDFIPPGHQYGGNGGQGGNANASAESNAVGVGVGVGSGVGVGVGVGKGDSGE